MEGLPKYGRLINYGGELTGMTKNYKTFQSEDLFITHVILLFCLFVLRLNVPVNNFSVMSGRSHCFLGN